MSAQLLVDSKQWSREAAFEYCRSLTKTHYENFTVASMLLPRDKRRHVSNLYAYCRTVDDLGDEAAGDRRSLLNAWREDLERCYGGSPRHPVMVALQDTIETFQIPQRPFVKLIKANLLDQERPRHRNFDELLYYCDHSANPCGRLFLYVFGYRDAGRQRLSDYTCTALQLTNFWQDVNRDWQKGRVYIPQDDLARFGCTEDQIARREFNDNFRELMAFQVERTREMFRQGARLIDRVRGAARADIALFTRGGWAVLDAIGGQGHDVLKSRPRLSRLRKGWLLASTWAGMTLLRRNPRF